MVLTADRILMADYPTLLDGMLAASQTTAVPEFAMRRFIAPRMPTEGVRAKKAPLGLRLIEAALIESGFSVRDVAVVPPEELARAIGPATRAVLVSSGDPLGLGMNDSTMSGIDGGQPYTQVWFERLCDDLKAFKARSPGLRIVAGGPGAWQLEQNPQERDRLGLDVVFCGYGEEDVTKLVGDILDEKPVDPVYNSSSGTSGRVPAILGPTSMGVVEISRGCGLGCPFCTMNSQPMVHMPVEKVVGDVETNVAGGVTSVSLISEDFLRYGSKGGKLEPERLLELVEVVRRVRGLGLIQLDHVNVSSAARFPKDQLRELFSLLTRDVRHRFLWVNIGVETASGELLERSSCRGKLRPFRADEWEDACERAIGNLMEAGFTPMLSLMFGIPGETEAHLRHTLAFVERLRGRPLVAFPLFYAPVVPGEKRFSVDDMTPVHWRLFRLCYEFNFKWMPRLYWDNQTGAGTSLWRRVLVQLGGRIKALHWKMRLARMARRAEP